MGKIIRIYVPYPRRFDDWRAGASYYVQEGVRLEVCTYEYEIKRHVLYPIAADGKIDEDTLEQNDGWPQIDPSHEYHLVIDSWWRWNYVSEQNLVCRTLLRELLDVMGNDNVKSIGIFNGMNGENAETVYYLLKDDFENAYLIGRTCGEQNILSRLASSETGGKVIKKVSHY